MKTNKAFYFILQGIALLLALLPENAFAKKICPAPVPFARATYSQTGMVSSKLSPVTPVGTTETVRMIQQCYFDDMPIYDQTNPNFAYVSVPDSTYCAEKSPILANYFGDQGVCDGGVPRVPDPAVIHKNFYKTWLPWGPLSGDPDSIGNSGSATCAANSGAMVMHAVVNNRDSSTTLVQGTGDDKSWVHDVFLSAAKPAEQEDWPDPLVTYSSNNTTYVSTYGDLNAGRRDPYRMIDTDLQQVVNMGSALGTDPTYLTETFWGWFDYYNNFVPNAQTFYSQQTSIETFRTYLSQGYVGIIGIGPVTVHISSRGGLEKVTLDPGDGGHIMAVQGFSSIADYKPSACNYNPITGKTHCTYAVVPGTESLTLSINDPWFANRRMVPITTLKAGTNQRTLRDGSTQTRYVDFGLNDDGNPNYTDDTHTNAAAEVALWPFDSTNASASLDVWSLTDGQTIYVIGITDLMLVS